MKKLLTFFVVTVFVVNVASIGFAWWGKPCSAQKKCGSCDGRGGGKSYMKAMMVKTMMKKEMVSTNDGGVIVLSGNKLLKYDQNLNLVKEVEVKVDMEATKAMMQKYCPSGGKGSKKGSGKGSQKGSHK